jgi:predicted transcriptional regulator
MEIAKAEVLKLVDRMPDNFEMEELQYRLYLRQKLEAAEEDIRAGRTLTHEEVVQETARWFAE